MATTALWWVRNDLRLSDNQALEAALRNAGSVVPVYILEDESLVSTGGNDKPLAFLLGGLRALDEALRNRGSRLIVRRGDEASELSTLMSETGASVLFAGEDSSPHAAQRDAQIAKTLPLHLTPGLTVQPLETMRHANGEPYTVFGPFVQAWKSRPQPQVRDVLKPPSRLAPPPDVWSLPLPDKPVLPSLTALTPGEAEAQRRLAAFVDWVQGDQDDRLAPIYRYEDLRNRLDLDGTSRLSPYLSLGMVSARQAVVSALSAMIAAPDAETRYSAELWLEVLIRREFALSLQHYHPRAIELGFRGELHKTPWENDQILFQAWAQGRTGYPLVDAAMRQLVQTGWMHPRARLVAASFLVKDLLVDWRWGEQFFAQHLLDADHAANNENWQRAAGMGTGEAPYLNILNPALQGNRYDPEGVFVRRWLPELVDVPAAYIHQPWMMPVSVQEETGCRIGLDYPTPIVDHGWAWQRAGEFFGQTQQAAKSR